MTTNVTCPTCGQPSNAIKVKDLRDEIADLRLKNGILRNEIRALTAVAPRMDGPIRGSRGHTKFKKDEP